MSDSYETDYENADMIFDGIVEEARGRLSSGIAENIEDVIDQLEDEGILYQPDHADALRRMLEMP